MTVVVAAVQEVGFRTKGWPLTVPESVTVMLVMSIGTPSPSVVLATFGMSLMTESSPKSLWRSSAPDWMMMFSSSTPPSGGTSTIPKRAGSPGWGTRL